ncbi:hypothetical protein BJY04DRAFT_222837 [Aspergillus karnatakaensis]|uniref:uncharacterized protein n=1 Tax=Aspergillus karnatakaensis TaxID=1810916 RepID=UPI003CCE0C90
MEVMSASVCPVVRNEPRSRPGLRKWITERLLRYALKASHVKVIIILGHLRSGKSSLFEALTGLEGYSKGGVESVLHIRRHPGLNDTGKNNADILREIARFLNATKDAVTYAGILYVTPATLQYSSEAKQNLRFLEEFCGLDYSPFITFVTTLWDDMSLSGVERNDSLMREMRDKKWSSFIDRGTHIYHHGRVYRGGIETLETLPLEDKDATRQAMAQEARRAHARQMIEGVYPADREYSITLVVRELLARPAVEATTAAGYLQMTHNQLVITGALANGAEGSRANNSNEPSESSGFNWVEALVSVVANMLKFPLTIIVSLLTPLYEFLKLLAGLISVSLVMIHRITIELAEVLIILPGGWKIIVGYSFRNSLYWRPWSPREVDAGSNDDLLNELREELAEESVNIDFMFGDILTNGPPTPDTDTYPESPYRAFEEAFQRASVPQEAAKSSGWGCLLM